MANKEAPVVDQIRSHQVFLKRRRQAEEAGVDYPTTRTPKEILGAEESSRVSNRLRLSQRAKSRYRA